MRQLGLSIALVSVAACGGGAARPDAGPTCDLPLAFEEGSDGHPEPLGAGAGEARAGRIEAAELPATADGLVTWAAGDFVLANDKVAMVIEDVGASDLYDPWGGRPVGIARVEGGALVEPANFGEILVLTERESVMTQRVSVLKDGSDGLPAVIRAAGTLQPTPFFDAVIAALYPREHGDIPAAIDYELAPDAEYVDVYYLYNSPRVVPAKIYAVMHGFMFTPRMPEFAPGLGFGSPGEPSPWIAFVDPTGTGFAYGRLDEPLQPGISVSGFVGVLTDEFDIAACAQTRRLHARITIGGPELDGLLGAVARSNGETQRELTGVVRDADGVPAPGVRVHAETADGEYLTRALTDAAGAYALHVPADASVELTAWRRGDAVVGPLPVAAGEAVLDLTLAPAGFIHVTAADPGPGTPLPVRVQVLPTVGSPPGVPGHFGEPDVTGGRLHVEFVPGGETTLRVPAGEWEVVVSRGYEYELHREAVTVIAGETLDVQAELERVVDTTGTMCGDFHIHTHRSNDSGDDARMKVRSAAADGLEIPVRSEHEYVEDFQPLIVEEGLTAWQRGIASIEMTSFEAWGHMGVVPLEPDPTAVNGGAPLWQRYPSADDPQQQLETLTPPEVFDAVRARPEQPTVIINHPRGGANYFDYVGYDRATGLATSPDLFDDEFTAVEVFNDASWLGARNSGVADWLSFLDHGRRVFAVGSSDSHGVAGSPVGYPRTCLRVGTDDPMQLTPVMVRDAVAAGHSTVSGGIYVDTWVGAAQPGDDVTGAPATVQVRVRVQAASWVDVDFIDLVVDGETVDTIAVLPEDADPANPAVRFDRELDVAVAPGAGSYVIVAAYGDATLEPVHPGRVPFGVTNPIFLTQ